MYSRCKQVFTDEKVRSEGNKGDGSTKCSDRGGKHVIDCFILDCQSGVVQCVESLLASEAVLVHKDVGVALWNGHIYIGSIASRFKDKIVRILSL